MEENENKHKPRHTHDAKARCVGQACAHSLPSQRARYAVEARQWLSGPLRGRAASPSAAPVPHQARRQISQTVADAGTCCLAPRSAGMQQQCGVHRRWLSVGSDVSHDVSREVGLDKVCGAAGAPSLEEGPQWKRDLQQTLTLTDQLDLLTEELTTQGLVADKMSLADLHAAMSRENLSVTAARGSGAFRRHGRPPRWVGVEGGAHSCLAERSASFDGSP